MNKEDSGNLTIITYMVVMCGSVWLTRVGFFGNLLATMKKIGSFLFVWLLILSLFACGRKEETMQWINEAEKPINVEQTGRIMVVNLYRYELTSPSEMYDTKYIDMTLPNNIVEISSTTDNKN